MLDRSRGFHVGTFPHIAGVLTSHICKGRQDATSKTIQATVHANLSFKGLPEILKEEILSDRGSDMLPWKNFIRAALTMRIKKRVQAMLFKSGDPFFVGASFMPGVKL